MTLDEIVAAAPADPDGNRWAYVSTGCLFWTSLPGSRVCPSCRATLRAWPLDQFVAHATRPSTAFGHRNPGEALAVAHAHSPCHPHWLEYPPTHGRAAS